MLQGFIILLLFQLLGEAIVALTGTPVPGPVIGMLLLWLALHVRQGPSTDLGNVSHKLIQHLSLLLLPAGVGLFFLPATVSGDAPAIVGGVLIGSVVSLLLTSYLIKKLAPEKVEQA